MATEEIKNSVEISSRINELNTEQLKVLDFIIDYSFKDTKEIYTNGTILVPLYRVIDAIVQKGNPYQST